MATMRTTLRDWFGFAGSAARVADSRHSLLIRWLRRFACLGVFFAVAGAVMQAMGHAWGADALGLGVTMVMVGFVLATNGDITDRRALRRKADTGESN